MRFIKLSSNKPVSYSFYYDGYHNYLFISSSFSTSEVHSKIENKEIGRINLKATMLRKYFVATYGGRG